jgi:membrane-associated phospholipid phosphatase
MRHVWPLLVLSIATGTAFAEGNGRQPATFIDALTYAEAFGVTGWHLIAKDPASREAGRRMSDAIIISGLLTEGLKEATHQSRPAPYQDDKKGFPSGHATLAFSVAAALSVQEAGATWIAFPIAAADAWAREDLGRHTWAQVLAGAALGTWVGRQAGQGKIRIFGHKDLAPAVVIPGSAELDNPSHPVGPTNQIAVWGTSF